MTLKQQLTEDMKNAMRAGDKHRLGVIRLMLAAIKQREVDERRELGDADVLATIEKMIKQRRDSIAQFEAGGREDLARSEAFEVALLQTYLPAQLSSAEVEEAVAAALAETGASGPQGMGKAMALLKARLAGRADMTQALRADDETRAPHPDMREEPTRAGDPRPDGRRGRRLLAAPGRRRVPGGAD